MATRKQDEPANDARHAKPNATKRAGAVVHEVLASIVAAIALTAIGLVIARYVGPWILH